MRHIRLYTITVFILFFALLFCACGAKESNETGCPFSPITWDTDTEKLISTIFGTDSCGLQYAYIHHDFSTH